ncbi:type II toxin-antitoxin system HipA family toxin [Castellaniella daejeonensis]|uniref:Type II toxin-antitoxin system HipA family toxin n=1 Tax=Castellaniella daejeonensis TaxID=659013 RepID=A0ABN0U2R0_9BURK
MLENRDSAPEDLLDVWVDDRHGLRKVGTLERFRDPGFVWQAHTAFYYDSGLADRDAVSITMPIRRAPYVPQAAGLVGNLPPIFDQSLPEGVLRDHLIARYAKLIEHMGDFDLAAITGASAIGRVLTVPYGQRPHREGGDPVSLEHILRHPDSAALMEEMMSKVASRSGVSGAHPKVLYRPSEPPVAPVRTTLATREFILKTPGEDYPWLSINEYLCMRVSARSGLSTAHVHLTESGHMLVIERFDAGQDGARLGFEDGATLCAKTARQKYEGSYETLFRNMLLMLNPADRSRGRIDLFKRIALSFALGDGDAHLKNFGVLYEDPTHPVKLAPVYDVCSTLPYLSQDQIALSLDGRRAFPSAASLMRFGRVTCGLNRRQVQTVFQEIRDAISATLPDLKDYCDLYPEFAEAQGLKLRSIWQALSRQVLGIPLEPT